MRLKYTLENSADYLFDKERRMFLDKKNPLTWENLIYVSAIYCIYTGKSTVLT